MKKRGETPTDIVRHNTLVRLARLYYHCGMTHQEIAERENLPRIKVTRLLKEAVEKKIVEFTIQDPFVETLELEEELKESFGLQHAVVTPTPEGRNTVYDVLGRFAADFLFRHVGDDTIIGVGWGRTLNSMLPSLYKLSAENVKVVSLTGGLAANSEQPNPYDVASSMADRLGAGPYYPLIPAIVESVASKDVLLKEAKVREILDIWDRLDLALMSIGIPAENTGLYYSFSNPKEEVSKVKALGAVGDLLAAPFDEEGNIVDADFLDRTIRIDFQKLKQVPIVAGVAGGKEKVHAIHGALLSGILTTIITDELCARQVLEIRNKRK